MTSFPAYIGSVELTTIWTAGQWWVAHPLARDQAHRPYKCSSMYCMSRATPLRPRRAQVRIDADEIEMALVHDDRVDPLPDTEVVIEKMRGGGGYSVRSVRHALVFDTFERASAALVETALTPRLTAKYAFLDPKDVLASMKARTGLVTLDQLGAYEDAVRLVLAKRVPDIFTLYSSLGDHAWDIYKKCAVDWLDITSLDHTANPRAPLATTDISYDQYPFYASEVDGKHVDAAFVAKAMYRWGTDAQLAMGADAPDWFEYTAAGAKGTRADPGTAYRVLEITVLDPAKAWLLANDFLGDADVATMWVDHLELWQPNIRSVLDGFRGAQAWDDRARAQFVLGAFQINFSTMLLFNKPPIAKLVPETQDDAKVKTIYDTFIANPTERRLVVAVLFPFGWLPLCLTGDSSGNLTVQLAEQQASRWAPLSGRLPSFVGSSVTMTPGNGTITFTYTLHTGTNSQTITSDNLAKRLTEGTTKPWTSSVDENPVRLLWCETIAGNPVYPHGS